MKQRFFGRIIIFYAVILAVAGILVELSITNAVRARYVNDVRDSLLAQASLMANDVAFQRQSSLDALCRQFKQQTGNRVTVIALDGRVLGESDQDSSGMENHSGRPELQQAVLNGSGMAIRHSVTLREDLLYVALNIARNGVPAGVIRLSMPLAKAQTAVNALRIKIVVTVLVVLIATGLFSIAQMERIRRLTRQIAAFSRSLARGEAGNRLYIDDAGEFSEIADSLNAMSGELRKSIVANEEETKRLNVILKSVPDILLILDASGRIQMSSSASTQYFGEALQKGRPVIEVIRAPRFLLLVEDACNNAATTVGELTLEYPQERHFSACVSPLFYRDTELSGFIVVLHDITQLKKLEQARKDFVANISHEIKTPVTAIGGFSEALLEGALHDVEYAEKFLTIIKLNSERINNLVDDLMTISKIELGVVKLEKTQVNIGELFNHVLAVLGPKAEEKHLALKTELPDMQTVVTADRDKLIQVMINLVDNAIKFTEQGEVTIGAARENGRPCLFVEDTGIGIMDKHLPRLGERFYRVDTARSRKMGGTGLGLAIVKHLVKAHGWDMRIESVPEKGTRVTILCS